MLSRLLAASNVFNDRCRPSVRFSRRDSNVYFWPLMKRRSRPLQPRVLALAHLFQRLAQMAHDMELVEQNRRLRRMPCRRHCETASTCPSPRDECARSSCSPSQRRTGARLASERSSPPNQIGRPRTQIAHHDPIGVALADRDLVDADHLWARAARSRELRLHVLLLQLLDRVPVQMQFLGHVLDGRRRQRRPTK